MAISIRVSRKGRVAYARICLEQRLPVAARQAGRLEILVELQPVVAQASLAITRCFWLCRDAMQVVPQTFRTLMATHHLPFPDNARLANETDDAPMSSASQGASRCFSVRLIRRVSRGGTAAIEGAKLSRAILTTPPHCRPISSVVTARLPHRQGKLSTRIHKPRLESTKTCKQPHYRDHAFEEKVSVYSRGFN